jgi:DNA polymerase-3 subunit epsilon
MGLRTRFAPCALADMGRCLAPCDGRTSAEAYGGLVDDLCAALREPRSLLRGLVTKMESLAEQRRFEEAALARDRIHALADVLARMRTDHWLTAGRLVLEGPDGAIRLDRGSLADAHGTVGQVDPIGWPAPRERVDELAVMRAWVRRHPGRVLACDRAPSEPVDGGAELAAVLARLRAAGDPLPDRGRRPRGARQTPG